MYSATRRRTAFGGRQGNLTNSRAPAGPPGEGAGALARPAAAGNVPPVLSLTDHRQSVGGRSLYPKSVPRRTSPISRGPNVWISGLFKGGGRSEVGRYGRRVASRHRPRPACLDARFKTRSWPKPRPKLLTATSRNAAPNSYTAPIPTRVDADVPKSDLQDFPRTIGRRPKSAGAGPKSAEVSADRRRNLGDGRPARNPEFRTPIFAARSLRNSRRRRRKGRRHEVACHPPGRVADALKSRFPDSPDFQGNRNSARTTDIGRRAAPYPQNLGPGSVARIPGFPHPGPRFCPRPPLKRPTAISGNVAPKSCAPSHKRRRRTSEIRTPRNFPAVAGLPQNLGLADASANRRRNIRPGRPSLDPGLRIPFLVEAPFEKTDGSCGQGGDARS